MLLFPAAVLCVMVLAAITIDLGLLQVRVQQLRSVAASAANDALGALDVDTLRDTGTISFDLAEARQIVADAVAAGPLPDASVDGVTITARPADRWEIAVTLSLVVEPVIAPAIGGRTGGWQPTVTEHALVAG